MHSVWRFHQFSGGVPILAAGQRNPAALPSCAAAAYCFLCILMKYFPNQAAGSRCPAACCWAALPSRSESSVVALPVSFSCDLKYYFCNNLFDWKFVMEVARPGS
ncbi:hypothetical protein M8J77_020734 [Diaphorina citri]|nr:hypothetical protein M8J77_021190 [Diaphorina citri]KAI5721432.1 hypothetical protein M8J77_020734 [Diaphorina citri]